MREHIEGFLVARSYAATSTKQRRYLLLSFCDAVGDDPTVANVMSWWAGLAHLADATRRAHLSAVRGFVAHLIAVGALEVDPTVLLSAPRVAQAPPVTIEPAEACRFVATITDPTVRLAAALMLGCGLRAFDVTQLDVGDVDVGRRVLRVHGKGGKVRLVPVPVAVADLLAAHVEGMGVGPLIRTDGGHRLSSERLRGRLTSALYRSGVKHGPLDGRSSHVLRRTCATTLLESGASLVDVQAVLGHSELSSTSRYLAVPDVKRLRSVIEGGPLSAA